MDQTLSHTHRDDLSGEGAPSKVEAVLYVVLEGERPLSGGFRASLAKVNEVRFVRGRERAWKVDAKGSATLEIPDPRMSGRHARLVRLAREEGGWLLEDLGSTNGTFVAGRRVTSSAIDESTLVTLGATCFLVCPEEDVPEGTADVLDAATLRSRPRGLVTLVPAFESQMPRLVRVAMAKLPMLLLGESGAGKEVLARTIHTLSGRTGPFVAINCGALAPTLVESQLFGYVRGAFSGANRDEPGLVRSSSGGTLFLDEVGELPPAGQATLLRVLQEREVLPVGGTKPVPVDLRVVAATLKPIGPRADGEAETTTFRPDLYARIAGYVHRLPTLAERRVDLGLIVADLLPKVAAERADRTRISPDLATALVAHAWPLNVRELEHVLSVATVTATDDLLRIEHTGGAIPPVRTKTSERPARPSGHAPTSGREAESRPPSPPNSVTRSVPKPLSPEDLRLRDELVAALERTHGNVSEIARSMQKTRMQIHRWMKRFGIAIDSFRGT
ncbi:Response regulatory protein [Labilithrix luteola]|uniref:Response regulatory protein n=1 Tax=Labilithrix luteola TaxID=1391654 RepID=A0A0K1PZH1_9BACT|nr:sigma 54-interacting transcriptional regulator [Labilithrix luteola]AKU98892.1 Response regulatory protein [Labilithrix luteola]